MCLLLARNIRCVNSSNAPSAMWAVASPGAVPASTRPGSTPSPDKSWSKSIRAISVRPRSIFCSAIPARRTKSLAGATRRALRTSSRRWSTATASRCGWRRSASIGMTEVRRFATLENRFVTREPAAKALPFELTGRRVFVAGHRGMVGAALVRRLASERCEVLTADHRALDLARQADTQDWLRDNRPDVIIVAAARVGGIAYNNAFPVD